MSINLEFHCKTGEIKMKNSLVLLIFLMCFSGCNSKNNELEKQQLENEKVKAEIQKLEKVKLLQTFKDKYKLAEAELKSIVYFFEMYITDNGELPKEDSLTLMSFNEDYEYYLKKIPLFDPWGNEYVFKRIPNKKDEYVVYSSGSDGVFSGIDQPTDKEWDVGTDIIYKNGELIVGLSKKEKQDNQAMQDAYKDVYNKDLKIK
jgi:hypothetical protein